MNSPHKIILWHLQFCSLLVCLVIADNNSNSHSLSVTSIIEIVTQEWRTTLRSHYNIIFLPLDVRTFSRNSARDGFLMAKHQVTFNNISSLQNVFTSLRYQLEEFHEQSLSSAVVFEQDSISSAVKNVRMISEYYLKPDGSSDRQLLLIIVVNEIPPEDQLEFETSLIGLTPFFLVDSPVYLVMPLTIREKGAVDEGSYRYISRFATVWELFSIKNTSIVQKLAMTKKTFLVPVTMVRRTNFHLAPIVATSVDYESDVNDVIASFKEERGRLLFDKGCSVSILRDIADCLNFTIVARRSTNYMLESPPGHLTGDGKLLLDGEADISIYLAYITESGAGLLQPLVPITVDRLQAFFRQPTGHSLTNIFILPFPPEVWLTLTVLWLLIAVIFLTIFRLADDDVSKLPSTIPEVTVSDTCMCVLSVICQRSSPIPPKNTSQMVLSVVMLLLAFFLYTVYCCSIICTNTVNDAPIKTGSDLVNYDYTILAEEYTHFANFLISSKYRDAKSFPKLKSPYIDDEDAALKISTGKYAFLSSSDIVAPLFKTIGRPNQEFCSTIDSITLENMVVFSGMFVTKGSPFKESFNFRLIQLMEKGLSFKYIAAMYRKNKPQCPPKPKKFQKLTLGDVCSAFGTCLLGSILSLVFLYIECLSHPRQKAILPWRMMQEQEQRRASILIYVTEH